ncbi:hypothetical protein AM588_10009314 [Phytophthora nicotianae]|uniref:Lariat debranching enzyme C-terminal domain-containing protein n=1 Tax=Phytophthora nicotianae TaxID=4792 RepID=A0A0W8DJY6_PHYNI|nr:hypothetical protein AM588_10009314 [Phytophthora nicotianae]
MVRVAVVGCAHGMLDDIYATVDFVNEMDPENPVELLLCCGDFECMRNIRDLETLACPPKYRALHAFHRYYKQEKTAPVLTIFVGGNHEASGYLKELHYGGWVAPNMFYLGAAGVVNVAGLRIAGLSGIYKQQHYTAGRFESMPFDNNTMRSVYHVRELEVFQLSHVQQIDKTPLGVFLSHDWPEESSTLDKCLPRREFMQILDLPTSTAANTPGSQKNDSDAPMSETKHDATHSDDAAKTEASAQHAKRSPPKIMFDLEWLAILRATHHLASSSKFAPRVPQEEMKIEDKDIAWVKQRLQEFVVGKKIDKAEGEWITDFVKTAPGHGEEAGPVLVTGNPQTDLLLELLKLPHVVTAPFVGGDATAANVDDPNEIDLDDDDGDENDVEDTKPMDTDAATSNDTNANPVVESTAAPADPCEIDLDL